MHNNLIKNTLFAGTILNSVSVFAYILIAMVSTQLMAEEITAVEVRNNEYQIINKITEKAQLKQFIEIWDTKHKVILRAMPIWLYKIDIIPGDRWLYHPNGYARLLSKKAVGVFKIDENNKFNKLLKTHKN